jgi:hypothetical protein
LVKTTQKEIKMTLSTDAILEAFDDGESVSIHYTYMRALIQVALKKKNIDGILVIPDPEATKATDNFILIPVIAKETTDETTND